MRPFYKGGVLVALSIVLLTVFDAGCSPNADRALHDRGSVAVTLLDASPNAEWLTYGNDYGNTRFSPLTQITSANVSGLIPAYVFQTGVLGPFEASPLVSNGTMYISTAYDGLFAINARTGDAIWRRSALSGHFRVCCGPVNRGVAITDRLVLIGQLDGVLVALDRTTGDVKWATVVADNASGASITMAPLVYRDSVLIGVAGSEFGVRGSLSSYSLANGKLQWRWYVTDALHWFGPSRRLRTDHGVMDLRMSKRLKARFADAWRHGGGGIWTTPAIDTSRNTIYVTTGNPWPDTDGMRRPGDNLFTDCIVALDASTGHIRWYFQQSPHDTGDLDAASPPILFDTVGPRGNKIEAVGEAGKTGLYYILDRTSGKLIRRSENFATLDPGGRGTQRWEGGSTWSPVSYDPALGYAIVSAAQHLRVETRSRRAESTNESMQGWNSGYGTVTALDVSTGRVAWQDRFNQGVVGGSVSTAGGVTFVGEGNGYFDALDTKSGERLWRFQTGAGVNAAPIVFELDGQEYVAVASGGNQQFDTPTGDAVFVFHLGRQ
jgi:glucose dehydrogenase